jgi:hypothetical protein
VEQELRTFPDDLRCLVFYVVFCTVLFVFVILVIVLSVLLTASDYCMDVFKLSLGSVGICYLLYRCTGKY